MFITSGIGFLVPALSYPIGNLTRMGPGLWPLSLSVLLVVLGVVTTYRAFVSPTESIGKILIRPVLFMALASIFFAAAVRPLGLAFSVFASVLIACLSVANYDKKAALSVAIFLAVFSVLVFIKGLGVPLQTFGPWLSF